VDCLRDYFFNKRQNETGACSSAFQRVTEQWIDGEDGSNGEMEGEQGDDNDSGDDEGAAVSLRPDAIGSAVAAVAVVMAMALYY
jgi:hypothetical protein